MSDGIKWTSSDAFMEPAVEYFVCKERVRLKARQGVRMKDYSEVDVVNPESALGVKQMR